MKPFSGTWLLLAQKRIISTGFSGPIPVGLLAASGLGHTEHSLLGGFSAFSALPSHLQPLCAWTPAHCPAQAGKSASSLTAASLGEAWPWTAGVPSWEQDQGLAEPHPSSTHMLPPQNHNTWDQVTSVAQQAQIVPGKVLPAPGRETEPPAVCVLPGPAVADAMSEMHRNCDPHTFPAAPRAGRRAEAGGSC